jgi:hypothetical protein
MCTITGKSKLKTATGYKFAIEENGEFYSVYTGINYKKGKVTPLTNKEIDNREQLFYPWSITGFQREYYGKTAVILNRGGAMSMGMGDFKNYKDTYPNAQFVLLEIKIKDDDYLMEGEFCGFGCLMGGEILSIKKVCDIE